MLTPDQVREVLLRFDLNNTDMAKELGGCSREAVRQVRQGISYRNVCPEIPRWHRRRYLHHNWLLPLQSLQLLNLFPLGSCHLPKQLQ